jgi:hypothetical protein
MFTRVILRVLYLQQMNCAVIRIRVHQPHSTHPIMKFFADAKFTDESPQHRDTIIDNFRVEAEQQTGAVLLDELCG